MPLNELHMKNNQIEDKIKYLVEQSNQVKDLDIKFQITKEIQKLREELNVLKKELSLLEMPTQQLLPDIFEEKRAIPNSFLRGALFGVVKKGKRAIVKDANIYTMSNYDLLFSGEYLDQNDLELWDTLIYLAKSKQIDNELRITLYELCKVMRLTPGKLNYERLISRASRLQFARVGITAEKQIFLGHLLQNIYIDKDGDGKLVIIFDKHIGKLFHDKDFTLISVDIRHILGDNQLARWLYNFYESHNEPIPFSIEFIQKLCRSEAEPKEFKRMIRTSLELVKRAHYLVNSKSKWDYEITENGYLIINKKGKNIIQAKLF
ncbi:MAG: hypothetical protein QG673_1093 [Pseudomonadota bacterium]|jgi:hypothetical protein|nr:hypothetical protein [Pseudomonadota bacterium]